VASKKVISQEPRKRKPKPALTPEAREDQLVWEAMNLAEDQILAGTASPTVITHFLKLGSTRNQLEQAKIENETMLLKTKNESIKSAQHLEEVYTDAIAAMKSYQGARETEVVDDQDI